MDAPRNPSSALPTLSEHQKKVYATLKDLNATWAEKGRSADDVMRAGKFAKGQMLSRIQELERLGVVKRHVRQKSAVYYLVK